MSTEPTLTQEDQNQLKAAAISANASSGESPRSLQSAVDKHYPRGDNTSEETKERALNAGQFERLLIGASQLPRDRGLEAWCVIVIAGRLGLRGSEVTHFSADWVDHYNGVINIPGHDTCTSGRGGDLCGHCKQAVNQRLQYDDSLEYDDIADDYWMPKTKAAVRSIPYEWSGQTQEAVAMLVDLHGGWPYSFSTYQRRLTEALKEAPGLHADSTSTHGLRSTAASYHAGNGVDREALKQMMGWRDDATPEKYLKIDGKMTARALGQVYR